MLLTLHAATTWMLTGLIWFVQLLHYPLMAAVKSNFTDYEREHTRRITPLVAPLMMVELALAAWLTLRPAPPLSLWMPYTGLALVAFVWATTFLVQVPLHEALSHTPSQKNVAKLVSTNWLRTVAWSLRALLALAMMVNLAG